MKDDKLFHDLARENCSVAHRYWTLSIFTMKSLFKGNQATQGSVAMDRTALT